MTETSAPPPPATPEPPKDAAQRRGPIRNSLESFGMAVLMAILLKYFALEAYVIPTPSMQPTMMGSPATAETDRILVDKTYYLFHEPKRWDIAVFKYPVRQIQSYVKRIVGVGGDRLKIGGGNLYRYVGDALEVLRKPERIQRTLWREIYPMRRKLALYEADKNADVDAAPGKGDVFGRYFNRAAGEWDIDADGSFVGTPSGSGKLVITYGNKEARNDYSDGYDLYVAAITRQEKAEGGNLEAKDLGHEAVTDLRIGFDLTPQKTPSKLAISIDVTALKFSFSLEVEGGKGKLVAKGYTNRDGENKPLVVTSEPFEFAIPAGETTPIRFAHLDDRLYAWRDGALLLTLDTDAVALREHLEVGTVVPQISISGAGKCTLGDVKIERDLHYTLSQLDPSTVIEVPEGHFFMMGDNTLGSADGRDWTAIRIGVLDGEVVDPEKVKGARVLWGNKRTKPFEGHGKPHDDDNPVPLYDGRMVFVDEMGQFHNLRADIDQKAWGGPEFVEFKNKGADGKVEPWIAKEEPRRFVPRAHFEGRPIARFLRSPAAFKITGWIR